MYRYLVYKIDIGKLIFAKKKYWFDRNIKKIILYLWGLCLVIKTIFWPAFDMLIVLSLQTRLIDF